MTRRTTIMLTALKEMTDGKRITALDYAKRYDTTRLGARIYDLRRLMESSPYIVSVNSERKIDKYGESYNEYFIPDYHKPYARKLIAQLEKKLNKKK